MDTPALPFLPATVSGVEIVAWDGFAYVAADGRTYWSGAEPSAEDLADAVAHPRTPPAAPPNWTPLEFLGRFTDGERAAILMSDEPGVVIFRAMAIAAHVIRADDERTQDGLAYLVAAGLLAADRPAQILAP